MPVIGREEVGWDEREEKKGKKGTPLTSSGVLSLGFSSVGGVWVLSSTDLLAGAPQSGTQ